VATSQSGAGLIAGLAVSFAVFLAVDLLLTGRLDPAGIALALSLGSAAGGLLFAGRPLRAFRAMPQDARMSAAAGGLLAFFVPPAIVAAVRLSDAPSGSVVVFWAAGGWALLAALVAAFLAWRSHSRGGAALALTGALTALAGVSAVVANWERPSSFSPLIRFAGQQMAILLAGAFLVVGALLLVSAIRSSNAGGTLATAGIAALGGATLWVAVSGPLVAFRSLSDLPVQVALAAVAWGAFCVLLPLALRDRGLASSAASIALAPVLLSALTWVEQLVGVAGPQPFIVPGVIAGSLIAIAGASALLVARGTPEAIVRPLWLRIVAWLPTALAVVALFLPAITATVDVDNHADAVFKGSWTMLGLESVAAWCAVALALLLAAVALTARQRLVPLVGAAACVAWFVLQSVPTHVLNGWLSPAVQSYYGTEYGSISFTAVTNVAMLLAVGLTALGFLAVLTLNALRRTPAVDSPSH
jgi:hypothetical protein